jgi:hypothetical protein
LALVSQTILMHQDEIRNRADQLAMRQLQASGLRVGEKPNKDGKEKATGSEKPVQMPGTQGKRLTSSEAAPKGGWRIREMDCPHIWEGLVPRGGRGKPWLTCMDCGARWERLKGPVGFQGQAAEMAASNQTAQNRPMCGCKNQMVVRRDHEMMEEFWGCATYPKGCRMTRTFALEESRGQHTDAAARSGQQRLRHSGAPSARKPPIAVALSEAASTSSSFEMMDEVVPAISFTRDEVSTAYQTLRSQGKDHEGALASLLSAASNPEQAAQIAVMVMGWK